MSQNLGTQTYSVTLDGSRTLMQPPFRAMGVILTNRTNQKVTLIDGGAGRWTARPGASAQFKITYPNDNYIATLDVTPTTPTTGECTITFTAFAIEEVGERPIAGPLNIAPYELSLNSGESTFIPTLGAIAVDLWVREGGGGIQDVSCIIGGTSFTTNIATAPYFQIVAGALYLANREQQFIRIGAGSTIPLPTQIYILCSGPSRLNVHAELRTT